VLSSITTSCDCRRTLSWSNATPEAISKPRTRKYWSPTPLIEALTETLR